MLNKFKVECGLNTINKMSQMFTDIQMSKDMLVQFREARANNRVISGVEFSIEVLTTGNWPIDPVAPCEIPTALKECVSTFELYYKNKH